MRPPKTTKAGPRQPGLVEKITAPTKPQDLDQSSRLPRVRARVLAPCGRRGLPVLVVTNCPFCTTGGPHVHRGGGGIRTAGCCSSSYYLDAVPAVSVEQRGAAA